MITSILVMATELKIDECNNHVSVTNTVMGGNSTIQSKCKALWEICK